MHPIPDFEIQDNLSGPSSWGLDQWETGFTDEKKEDNSASSAEV